MVLLQTFQLLKDRLNLGFEICGLFQLGIAFLLLCLGGKQIQVHRVFQLDAVDPAGKGAARQLDRLSAVLELSVRCNVSLIEQLNLIFMVVNFEIYCVR